MKANFALLITLLCAPFVDSFAQDVGKGRPPFAEARWIGLGDPSSIHADTRFAFRQKLVLEAKPTTARIRMTADARYMLWVNARFVGRGPARGFPWAQPYDDYDLTPFLRSGANWLAAEVYQFGFGSGGFGLSTQGNGVYAGPGRTGLLIEGEAISPDGKPTPIRTDATWQARKADWAGASSAWASTPRN